MSDRPEQDSLDTLSDHVHSDLASRLGAWEDGYMLVKFLAVAEVIDQQGERALTTIASKDLKVWETVGMLEYARMLEQADAVADVENDD